MAPNLRLAAVLELLDNTTTAEALAARHGVTVAEVEAWRSLYVAGLRQASNGQVPLQRRARTGLKLGLVAAGVSLLVGGVAWAQLVTFAADTPARATQVNANFTYLKNWIERKVGPLYTTGTGADQVRIGATQDVGTSGTAGGLIVGNTGGLNLGLDGDELQARNANAASALTLNRRGGTVTLGSSSSTVDVPGTLNARLGRGASALGVMSWAGPLPLSTNFTTEGGTVVLTVAGSGFSAAIGNIGMTVYVDNVARSYPGVYSNATGVHRAFVSQQAVLTNLAAGTHSVRLEATANTVSDANDNFQVTFVELPF